MTDGGVLIVGAAPAPDPSGHYGRLIARAARVIAADGGLLTCLDVGRVPDLCIGDFDSTPAGALARAGAAGADIRRYPREKDVSDLDLAVGAVRETGGGPVTLCAAFSGRLDHTLAALGTLQMAADIGAVADEPDWMGVPLDSATRPECALTLPAETVVSVFAVAGPARVSARGFDYGLDRTALVPLSSYGLSNVSRDATQWVRADSGAVLVIVNRGSGALPLQSVLAITDIL